MNNKEKEAVKELAKILAILIAWQNELGQRNQITLLNRIDKMLDDLNKAGEN